MAEVPDTQAAIAMAGEVLSEPATATRFPTGSSHFVFEVRSPRGRTVVVRASRPDDKTIAEDALYWSRQLRPLGIPLPEVLHADTTMARHPFPFLILERLPGRDLHYLVNELPSDALRQLARRLARLQAVVAGLPAGSGYGFTPRLDGPFPHADWQGVVSGLLQRSRRRISAAGVVGDDRAEVMERAAESFRDYFDRVPPTPFLHDITTKNVIVNGTRLSGIVDVDDLCFGDPLFLVGLIRTALLAHGRSPLYAELWLDALRPDPEQHAALDFYTALFAHAFLSELGQRFNREEPEPVDPATVARLQALIDQHLGS